MGQCENKDRSTRCKSKAILGTHYCWRHVFKSKRVKIIASLITIIVTTIGFLASLKELGVSPIFEKKDSSVSTPNHSLTPSTRIGQFPGNSASFSVYPNYDPSGSMGDIGDVTVQRMPEGVRFIYKIMGRGPHEWDWKYVNGKLNSKFAKFAGVMYLNPPNNWGMDPAGGFDLRRINNAIKWEARSFTEPVNVEFIIGGVLWKWDDQKKDRVAVPYSDSMPRFSLGTKTLTASWQPFETNLSHMPEDNFRCVVGGFAWIINWESNQVQLNNAETGPEPTKIFEIEIRNIHYERLKDDD